MFITKKWSRSNLFKAHNSFSIYNPIPYSLDNIDVYYNGRILDSALYTLAYDPEVDPTSVIVSWTDGDIEGLELKHAFVIDYYTSESYLWETEIVEEIIDAEFDINLYEDEET